MRRALDLARAQLGRTAPNPSVGCVIVSNDVSIGEGATGTGGRPHGEEIALPLAAASARGATAYVSLEPCSQRSSGAASCAERLVAAGLSRVVIACSDPNPAALDGASVLRTAGIEVDIGLLEAEARALNCGFFKLLESGRPWVAVAACSDGFDVEFDLRRNESFEGALDRLGDDGNTRVWVRAGTPLAAQLTARGLVDEDLSKGDPK